MTRQAAAAVPNVALANLRAEASLSQAEVATRINKLTGGAVTAQTVSRWERGTIVPTPIYRRAIAEVYRVPVEQLGFPARSTAEHTANLREDWMTAPVVEADPRVDHSQAEWRRTRRNLNGQRPALTRFAATLYPPHPAVTDTGLIARDGWIPDQPVDLADVTLMCDGATPPPAVDGTEPESAHVRPRATLTRPYQRYTHAIRDLEQPRLFENRVSWRLLDLDWSGDQGRMRFGTTTYFAAMDLYEAAAHEMAYVHLDDHGQPAGRAPTLRDLPLRRRIGDPFTLSRRAVMPSVSTLTIRAGDQPTFVLHRRDPKAVAIAGGMLHVIPSGIFQPSSVLPDAAAADFDLWRNIMREYSEELLGNADHEGDGEPVDYRREPFATMDTARRDGRLRVHCLGVALDALTLAAEILTVAVVEPATFDAMAADFVEVNDEGSVVGEWLPFTASMVSRVLASGMMAPGGGGCLSLAWRHRDTILGD
jgi:transcriptional regulator with XRE-family HTH domain